MQKLAEKLKTKTGIICDMDGVIYHGNRLLPGAKAFVQWLKDEEKKYLFLTNSSQRSPKELKQKLARLGIDVEEEHFYTSALATAGFLAGQACGRGEGGLVPGNAAVVRDSGKSVYVIGEGGLINALYDAGFSMNEMDPDYVVVGESRSYTFERIEEAINLVRGGAKLIGTNPDLTGPGENGIVPATGALISPIELATRSKAYFVGKPNPLMMRQGLKRLGCKREDVFIIGDRMDTDIIAGIESEIETILVLSGVTSREDLSAFAYKPDYILEGVSEIPGGGNKE